MNFSETKSQRGSIAIFVLILGAFGVAILTAFLQESIFHVKYCSSARPPVNLTVQAYSFSDLMLIYLTEINSLSTSEHRIAGFKKENPSGIRITNKDLGSSNNAFPIINPDFSYRLTEKLLKRLKTRGTLPSFFSFDLSGSESPVDSNIYEIKVTPKSESPNSFTSFKVTYYLEDLLDKVPLCRKFQEIVNTGISGSSRNFWTSPSAIPDFSGEKLKPENFPVQNWDTVAEKLQKPIPELKKYFTINHFLCKDADSNSKDLRAHVKINLYRCNQSILNAIFGSSSKEGYPEASLSGPLSGTFKRMKDDMESSNKGSSSHFCDEMRYFALTTRVTSGIKSVSVRITCRTTPFNRRLDAKNRLPFEVLNVEEF